MHSAIKLTLSVFAGCSVAACMSIPGGNSARSGSSSDTSAKSVSSAPTRAELEAQRRTELSTNDKRVEFRSNCEGLFIPEVKRTKFQGLIPVYSMFVLNNSKNRYAVKYDLTLLEKTQSYSINSTSQYTEERDFIVRPESFVKFDIAEQKHSGGRTIADVQKIVVLKCEKT